MSPQGLRITYAASLAVIALAALNVADVRFGIWKALSEKRT